MLHLYSAGGAGDFELLGEALDSVEQEKFLRDVGSVLVSRRNTMAAEKLKEIRFKLYTGTNHFNDDFNVLYAEVSLNQYEELRRQIQDRDGKNVFRKIALVATEDFDTYVRFIAVGLVINTEVRNRPAGHLFICHATEDKDEVVIPLGQNLKDMGFSVWIDKYELTVGDSLRREIEKGITACSFGVVILSPSFFEKNWPQAELDGLATLENTRGSKVILPVRHEISIEQIAKISPLLAGKLMASTADGLDKVAEAIRQAVVKTLPVVVAEAPPPSEQKSGGPEAAGSEELLRINESETAEGLKQRGGSASYSSQSRIRVKVVDRMPTEADESIPIFYRETSSNKKPLPSAVIVFVVELLNKGLRTATVDSAILDCDFGGESVQTRELYTRGTVVSGKSYGYNFDYQQPFSLSPGEPRTFTVAFRVSKAPPELMKDFSAHLVLVDSDGKQHESESFTVFENQGYRLTRQMAERLFGQQSDDR